MMELDKIYCMDNVIGMKQLEAESVDLTVTSPPYDNLRTYNGFSWDFEAVANQLYRVTKKGGVVVWIVADQVIDGSESGTSFRQALHFKEIGFNLHDTMIWEKTGLLPTQDRYYNAFEYVFVLSKGKPNALNFIEDHKTTAGGRTQTKDACINKGNHKKGDGVFVRNELSRRTNIWRVALGKNVETENHPAPFPEQLAQDHIISWSNEGDTVLDPFMGSGTTAKMAILNQRHFIGFEISQEYVDLAIKRITPYKNQITIFEVLNDGTPTEHV